MESVLAALRNQLTTAISYCKDSGYIARDPYKLMQMDKYPWFNLTPEGILFEEIEDMPREYAERRIYIINVQFAERSMNRSVATLGDTNIIGLFPFLDDIMDAIRADLTLNSTVDGKEIASSFVSDIVELQDERNIFIAGGELIVRFYKDVVL